MASSWMEKQKELVNIALRKIMNTNALYVMECSVLSILVQIWARPTELLTTKN